MKKIIACFAVLLVLTQVLCSCGERTGKGVTINVYNWGEYISDGSEGSLDVIAEFEERTGIKVNYTTFESNEDLHAKLKSGATSYDVIIPSDYMIARLIAEDMLSEINYDNIPNYKYIADEYKNLYYDTQSLYSVPYSVGMVGLIYNTKLVEGTPDSWSIMWDEKYAGQILNFNNPRDAFSLAQFLLSIDVNTTSESDWRAAKDKLLEQKPIVQGYVMDEVFNKMESGEAAIAAYYAGDFLTMHDNNEDLAFVYPKEGTNIFIDAMCVPKGISPERKAAAEQFINFMLDPDIAKANAEYICYASPNTAVFENEDYELYGNEYLYPESVSFKTEYFHDLPEETLTLMNNLWEELKIESSQGSAIYIICGAVVLAIAAVLVIRFIRKKRMEKNY